MTQDTPRVTQADREAAAELLGGATPVGLLEGSKDSLSLVQAFARHRTAAEDASRAEVERLRADIWQAVENEAKAIWEAEPISGSRAYYGCEWDELTDRKRDAIRLQALASFGLTCAALLARQGEPSDA